MQKRFKFFDFLGLLGGFIYGNLFAINYSSLNWNFFVLFFIIFFLEIINKMFYKNLFDNLFSVKNGTQKQILLSKYTVDSKKRFFWKQKINFWNNTVFSKNAFPLLTPNLFWNLSSNFTVNFWVLMNTLKRGFLLGLFVEAFKVGS